MIKTKKFLAFILIAVAMLFAVGCGEKQPPELVAPSEIEISCDYAELEPNALKLGGDDMELSVIVADGCDPAVTWSSSNEKIATVDENGNVTAVAMGKAVITATSVKNTEVSASFDIAVYGKTANDMLQAVVDYVVSAMPQYIQGGLDDSDRQIKTKLPCDYLTEFVEYSYTSQSSFTTYTNNRYYSSDKWNDNGVDAMDTLECSISFKPGALYTGNRKSLIQIHVVKSLEDNDFKAVDIYNEGFDEFFASKPIDAWTEKELVLTIPQSPLLTVTWESSDLNVFSISKNGDDWSIVYTKPLDDTSVNLKATVMTASGVGATKSVTILGKGYSKQDKIDFFREQIAGNVLALVGQRVASDIKIPTKDTTFEMAIEWESSNPDYLTANGKYTDHPDDDVNTPMKVTLTANIMYLAADEYSMDPSSFTSPNSFYEPVEFVLDVYPCTQAGRAINQILAVNAQLGDKEADGSYLGYFPYGRLDRADDKLVLPATMEEAGYVGEVEHPEWKSASISWVCGEEGLFDKDYNLLKQYLRYHPVTFTGTVTLGTETLTFEVPLNVGLAKFEGGVHIGGSFSRLAVQTSELTTIAMDSLCTLSGFDDMVGKIADYYKGNDKSQWYSQFMRASEDLTHAEFYVPDFDAYKNIKAVTVDQALNLGFDSGFGGVTVSWENPANGLGYTFFATEAFTWVFTDDDIDENGDIKTVWMKRVTDPATGKEIKVQCKDTDPKREYRTIKSLAGRDNKQYDGMIVVNASSKAVKFPVIYYDASLNLYGVNFEERIGSSTEAGSCLGIYGDRPATIITNGVVGCSTIDGQNKYNDALVDLGGGIVDDETGNTEYAPYLWMEPGAVIIDACEGCDSQFYETKDSQVEHASKDYATTGMCTPGNVMEVSFWKIHPCNTVTTTSEWEGEFGANVNYFVNLFQDDARSAEE